jgi:hypothetical protein
MDSRAAIHVVDRPLLPVSTDYGSLDTLVDRLRSVATKSRSELTQSVANLPLLLVYQLLLPGSSVVCLEVDGELTGEEVYAQLSHALLLQL